MIPEYIYFLMCQDIDMGEIMAWSRDMASRSGVYLSEDFFEKINRKDISVKIIKTLMNDK